MSSFQESLILLAHGGGGDQTNSLIKDLILSKFANPILEQLDDSACLTLPSNQVVFTTDSYVVNPLFFPGGDIGKLAACGTLNDLAMQGAKPLYLSMGLILEEGLEISALDRILKSMADVINPLGVKVVTGDTKVVQRGHGHGCFINTTGLGVALPGIDVHAGNAKPGDKIILTGTMGDHGMAIMCQREGLKLSSPLLSDTAALWPMMESLLNGIPEVSVLRDPTRGGVAAALNDIARASGCGINIMESRLPIRPEVRGAASLLGLDPLAIANEGKAIVVCPSAKADDALKLIQSSPLGQDAAIIGEVAAEHPDQVFLQTTLAGRRLLDYPSGEMLPRIC